MTWTISARNRRKRPATLNLAPRPLMASRSRLRALWLTLDVCGLGLGSSAVVLGFAGFETTSIYLAASGVVTIAVAEVWCR